jgi:hypothetical protein
MSSCKAVARAIVEMSGGVDNVRCVVAYGIGDERG